MLQYSTVQLGASGALTGVSVVEAAGVAAASLGTVDAGTARASGVAVAEFAAFC